MAASLREQVNVDNKRSEVIDDAVKVLDQEVGDKSGVSGMVIKGAYKALQGIRPGFVRQVVDHLLDDFLDALNPIYQEALTQGQRPGGHLESNSGRVADALLTITDRRAEKAERAAIKKTYEKLRPSAKKHVEAAAPRLGALLDRHAQTSL